MHCVYWRLGLEHPREIRQSRKIHSLRDSKIGLKLNADNYPTCLEVMV